MDPYGQRRECLGPPEHSRGKYERERPASGSGRKEAARGRLRRAHRGGGGRSRREEEAGGGGGRSGAARRLLLLAKRSSARCPRTRKALIRRPEPPGRPLPPRRPRHAGPEPAPPRPRARGSRRRRTEEWGGPRRRPAPGWVRACNRAGARVAPGSTHHPGSCPSPEMDEGWRQPRGATVPTGGQALS